LANLAAGFRSRYERTGAGADRHLAIAKYREACERGLARAAPAALVSSIGWGDWALERTAWHEAAEAYCFGMSATESLMRVQVGRAGKEKWLREVRGLPGRGAYCFAKDGDSTAAAVALEGGRAYLLTEALERNRRDLITLQHSQPAAYERYRKADERVAIIEAWERNNESQPPRLNLASEAHSARSGLSAAIKAIRAIGGWESFQKPPTFKDIQSAVASLPGGSALVYLATIEQGSVALIVQDNREPVKTVWLNFTEGELASLLVRRRGEEVIGGLLPAQLGRGGLQLELIEIMPMLSGCLMAPLSVELRALGVKQVVFVLSGRLNLLPLHAASYEVQGITQYFGGEFTVSYAPNARALLAARRELAMRTDPTSFVGVGNPLPHRKPLLGAEMELMQVAELFAHRFATSKHTPLLREQANKAALLKVMPEAGYVHLACHGGFVPSAPLESALQLANEEPLNLREILFEAAKPLRARLIVLSACQTGISDFGQLADEYIGLPAGFLQAGVPGVLGTLWPVGDLSTALLMIKFYELQLFGNISDGKGPLTPTEALAGAQRWLRELTNGQLHEYFLGQQNGAVERADHQSTTPRTRFPAKFVREKLRELERSLPDQCPYANPYFWAPFVLVGV